MAAPTPTTEQVLEIAREEGFDLAGVAPLEPPPAAERFRGWLAAGRHAGMSWLARSSERICDPRQILPGARSLVVVGLAHARPESLLDRPRLGDGHIPWVEGLGHRDRTVQWCPPTIRMLTANRHIATLGL